MENFLKIHSNQAQTEISKLFEMISVGLQLNGFPFFGVDDELCHFPGPIDHSKSSLQILWLLPENIHLKTKRSNEGKTESERARRGSAS
jgi:hypothetical protein